jgi:hypothetical protein
MLGRRMIATLPATIATASTIQHERRKMARCEGRGCGEAYSRTGLCADALTRVKDYQLGQTHAAEESAAVPIPAPWSPRR